MAKRKVSHKQSFWMYSNSGWVRFDPNRLVIEQRLESGRYTSIGLSQLANTLLNDNWAQMCREMGVLEQFARFLRKVDPATLTKVFSKPNAEEPAKLMRAIGAEAAVDVLETLNNAQLAKVLATSTPGLGMHFLSPYPKDFLSDDYEATFHKNFSAFQRPAARLLVRMHTFSSVQKYKTLDNLEVLQSFSALNRSPDLIDLIATMDKKDRIATVTNPRNERSLFGDIDCSGISEQSAAAMNRLFDRLRPDGRRKLIEESLQDNGPWPRYNYLAEILMRHTKGSSRKLGFLPPAC